MEAQRPNGFPEGEIEMGENGSYNIMTPMDE
jgi:hypothetical protein